MAFLKEGHLDSISDDIYLKIDGTKYYRPGSSTKDGVIITDYDIQGPSAESVSYAIDESKGTLDIDIKGFSFTVKILAPIEHTIDVKMSIRISGSVFDNVFLDASKPMNADITMNGEVWPHYEEDPETLTVHLGDETHFLGFLISFDTRSGSVIPTMRVFFYSYLDNIDIPEPPVKENAVFKRWVLESGQPAFTRDYSNIVDHDMTIYAEYYEEPIPDSLGNELYMTSEFLKIMLKLEQGRKTDEDVKNLFGSGNAEADKHLLQMALLTSGEVDEPGLPPYIEIDGTRYYGTVKDSTAEGLTAGVDYSFSIHGTGSSHCDSTDGADDNIHEEFWDLYNLDYDVEFIDKDSLAVIGTVHVRIDSASLSFFTLITGEPGCDVVGKIPAGDGTMCTFRLFRNNSKGLYCDYLFDASRYGLN